MGSPPRGDNHPPGPPLDEIDPRKLIDLTIIVPLLKLNYPQLAVRRDELKAGIERWVAAHMPEGPVPPGTKPVIVDDDDCGDTLDFLTQCRDFGTKEVEPARKAVKEPVDKIAKAIQAFFVDGLSNQVQTARQPIEDAYSLFLIAKRDKVRHERAVAAFQQQQRASQLAQQAKRAASPVQQDALLEQAIEAENEVERLKLAAEAPAADLTRVRGDMGSVGGLKTTWAWEVEALMDLVQAVGQGRESIDLLTTNQTHINALVRGADGRRKIPGLRIFEEAKGR